MRQYLRTFDGSQTKTYENTRPSADPSSNRVTSSWVVTSRDQLSSVSSDGTKPWPRIKPQNYVKHNQVHTTGYRRLTDQFGDGYIRETTSGALGGAVSGEILGDRFNAYNDALGKLTEFVRGGIDLSIDGFQHSQSIKLARNILAARKSVEKLIIYALAVPLVLREKLPRQPKVGTRKYYRWLRRKELRKMKTVEDGFDALFRRPMRTVGSLHLQFTYGLKPTLQTIYDLVDRTHVRVGNNLHVRSKNGRKHVSAKITYTATTVTGGRPQRGWATTLRSTSKYMTQIGGTYLPGKSFVESASRLSSLNPASIAWELLPFSFVVDWFLDIGGYLRNMETALLSNMLGSFSGFVTNTEIHTGVLVGVGNGLIDGTLYEGAFTGNGKRVTKKRTVLTTFPLPRPPRFRADLGSGRMLNGAALLTILFRK